VLGAPDALVVEGDGGAAGGYPRVLHAPTPRASRELPLDGPPDRECYGANVGSAHRVAVLASVVVALVSAWTACSESPRGGSSGPDGGPTGESGTSSGSMADGWPPEGSTYGGQSDAAIAPNCDGGDGGSLFGQVCPTGCSACCPRWFSAQCLGQGGVMYVCNDANCGGALTGTCWAPPAHESGKFQCATVNCSAGQVCVRNEPGPSDSCESYRCDGRQLQCADAGTCACINALQDASTFGAGFGNHYVGCTEDDAGNVTVTTTY
jgi:hypothetical protein